MRILLLNFAFLIILANSACAPADTSGLGVVSEIPPTQTQVAGVASEPVTPAQQAPPEKTEVIASQTKAVKPTSIKTAIPQTEGPTKPTTPDTIRRTASPTKTRLPSPTPQPLKWEDLPVVPAIADKTLQIYARGLELGNDPLAFSKIGDCGSTPAWFLGDFDRGPRYYRLGEYEYLQEVIDVFKGSFDRTSLAARSGFNTAALFVPLWADREYCQSDETPLACEYRVHRPVIAFIMLGTNDVWNPEEFEPQMRKLIEYSIEKGVIPILSTKADNQEGDGSINATIARLAQEYEVPLWNFWRVTNALPDHGLQEDKVHLSWGANFFDKPETLQLAWPQRNLTALQVLDAVWQKVSGN